jgi:hypothetical protein
MQMMARESAKGGERIFDFHRGKANRVGRMAAALDYRGGGAAARRLGEVGMAVAPDAAERHEQGAGGERARVDRHSTYDRVRRAEHLAAGCGGDFVEPESALVDWYRRRHRYARAGRTPEADADLTVITCPDAA